MVILLIGPSGSGKDTQAELLVDKYEFVRVSTGDLLRDISNGENEIQKIIKQAMNEGFLADNFVFGLTQIYLEHLAATKLLLSGVVRRLTQIELLDETLDAVGKKLDKVIYFDLNDEEAIRRMSGRLICDACGENYHLIFNPPHKVDTCDKCGAKLTRREDDNPEAIKNRLADFHKDNDEILANYEARGMLIKIDASSGIEEIHREVVKALGFSELPNGA